MILFKHYLPQIVALLSVLVILLILLVTSANARLARTQRTMRKLLTGPGGDDLEAMLKRCLAESKESQERCDEQETQVENLAAAMQGCVQRIGLVRYDAFGDVSGSQSFSLALLDNNRNGAIVTSLLGRNNGRCFGKPVANGVCEQALSGEESEALQMALDGTFSPAEPRPVPRSGRRERARAARPVED